MSGYKVIINGESFAIDELDLIPCDILHSAKQERKLDDGLAFRGEDSVFSNFHEAEIVIVGERFNSVEQNFDYCKAVEHGYTNLAKKILNKANPRDQKYLGDLVYVKDSWEAKREKVLYVGIYAKFSQNIELGRMLLASGNLQLYEATGDMDYGCGLGLKSSKWENKDWDGSNICGNLLMKVREELTGKIDMGDMTIDDINEETPSTVTSEAGDLEESGMDTTTSTDAMVGVTPVADNTPVEIASQTMSLASKLPAPLEDKTSEYKMNFPFLEKAKSPAAVAVSTQNNKLRTEAG